MAASTKLFWRLVGWLLFLCGLTGLIIPFFPTTVFWILAVLALQRSDPAFAERIRGWPKIGPEVANFLDFGVISPIGKLAALGAMGASATLTATLLDDTFTVAFVLSLFGIVALYIATRPSRLRDDIMARRMPAPLGGETAEVRPSETETTP